jgi:hypothetical protein
MTIPPDPGSNNVGTIHAATGYDKALHTIEEKWESAYYIAMDSLGMIPEIIPDLYPPGSDDHGLPMEPHTAPSGPHLIPDNEIAPIQREDTTHSLSEGDNHPDSEGDQAPVQQEVIANPDPEGETQRDIHHLILPTEYEI